MVIHVWLYRYMSPVCNGTVGRGMLVLNPKGQLIDRPAWLTTADGGRTEDLSHVRPFNRSEEWGTFESSMAAEAFVLARQGWELMGHRAYILSANPKDEPKELMVL